MRSFFAKNVCGVHAAIRGTIFAASEPHCNSALGIESGWAFLLSCRHRSGTSRRTRGALSNMVAKVFAVLAVLLLPLNLTFWYRSHSNPVYYRSDVTAYRSLTLYVRDGVVGIYLLTMPTPTAGHSESRSILRYDATPSKGSLHLSSVRAGELIRTWLVFPFWLSTLLLTLISVNPVFRGPVRQLWRRWRGRCMFCGYDLTGNRTGRCSECGEHFAARKPPKRPRSTARR